MKISNIISYKNGSGSVFFTNTAKTIKVDWSSDHWIHVLLLASQSIITISYSLCYNDLSDHQKIVLSLYLENLNFFNIKFLIMALQISVSYQQFYLDSIKQLNLKKWVNKIKQIGMIRVKTISSFIFKTSLYNEFPVTHEMLCDFTIFYGDKRFPAVESAS